MRTIITTLVLVIAVALLSVLLLNTCKREPVYVTVTTRDTIPGDSVPYAVTVDRPIPQYIDTGGWRYYDIDTLAILRDYLSKVAYNDTLKDDSSAFIAIVDTLSRNRIQSRTLYYANRRPTIINNTTITQTIPETMRLYAGAMYSAIPGKPAEVGPVVLLTTPKGYGYSYAYGVNQKTHTFSFVLRVRLKRKVPPD